MGRLGLKTGSVIDDNHAPATITVVLAGLDWGALRAVACIRENGAGNFLGKTITFGPGLLKIDDVSGILLLIVIRMVNLN